MDKNYVLLLIATRTMSFLAIANGLTYLISEPANVLLVLINFGIAGLAWEATNLAEAEEQ